ncbi:glycosyltransferase family 2 protein [Candidatus Thiosymbion oneisti]|uniref:glycosyltransferase family 2 protein n=1 Tax=Candidatus Thiosymbion oneisti TaxID=589554 RepID=UPI000AD0AF6C|nr:glycosyltransferase family 2 protein [Candidatus Thiosymbion oneisti]
MNDKTKVCVVIPCYKVRDHILGVIKGIGSEVDLILVIDDACPENSGAFVGKNCVDPRVRVLRHAENQGVGGAVMTGYETAIDEGMGIIVKVDGDGQMDPALIPFFIQPIVSGEADYTKGNRFFDIEKIRAMPAMRLFGNAILSFMTKLSSGYWNIFDPTNGYTAIHVEIARHIPFNRVSRRYFFETDILFRLNTLRAVVVDVPMDASYGNEVSNLKISRIIGEFLLKHCKNFFKRIFYNYYLRDMSLASLELPLGVMLFVFGVLFGGYHWLDSAYRQDPATTGTVMLATLPTLLGIQFVLAFISYDIMSVPTHPIHSVKRSILKSVIEYPK